MEAQEQFESDMRKFEQDEEERKRLGLSLLLDKEISEPSLAGSESVEVIDSTEEIPEENAEESSEEKI